MSNLPARISDVAHNPGPVARWSAFGIGGVVGLTVVVKLVQKIIK